MIENSFIFLEKVSTKKEQNIWQQGIKNWDHFLKTKKIKGISYTTKQYYGHKLKQAQLALYNDNLGFFNLPQKENWRLYNYFRNQTGYLDIEVDSKGKIILVGISNHYHTNTFVKGINLEKKHLTKELSKYKLIVTFNGSSFDLPKLKKQLNITITQPHIDLKPLCINLNLKGGLKEVEKQLNLNRPPHLKGNPVDLWKALHASGDREYLDLLIAYNNEDIENLKWVLEHVHNKLTLIKHNLFNKPPLLGNNE